jgi:hypothetical protein
MKLKKWQVRSAVGAAIFLVAIQLVPYGRIHENPPVTAEPKWSSPEVRALAARACFDCHSNETKWPWYSFIAPVSWVVAHDVYDARDEMNFSEWDKPQEAKKTPKLVRNRAMPLKKYLWLHAEADLTNEERERLASGLAGIVEQSKAPEQADD